MFRKIRNRILILNMVMVSSVVVIAFAVIYITTYVRMQNDNRDKLMFAMPAPQITMSGESMGQGAAVHIEQGMTETIVSGYSRLISPDEGLSFSLILDSQNNIIEINSMVNLSSESYALMASRAMEAAETTNSPGTVTIDGRIWQFMVSPILVIQREGFGGAISFSGSQGELTHIRYLDVTDSYRTVRSLAFTLSGVTLVILAVFFFISRLFADRAIKPMEEAWQKQTRFITDASHELKTPLSIITANCGVLYAAKEEPVGHQLKWLDSIMRAGDRMAGLVSGMLSLVSLEDAQPELLTSPIDLSAETTAAVGDIEAAVIEKNLMLEKEIRPDIYVESDKEYIRRILSILLDNAVKYTDSGGKITVLLKKEKRRAVFSIRNSGSGIPAENLPRLFDRFYRADPSRSSATSGYGLGLAIAKAIANRLGDDLSVESIQGEYTEFRFSIGS